MNKYRIVSKIVNSMEKVMPETEPALREDSGTCFKNERFNFQLCYKNFESYTIKETKIDIIGDLAPYITLRNVDLMPVTVLPPCEADDYFISKTVGVYPELLKPMDDLGVCLPYNQWRSVFVSVYDKNLLPAGNHNIKFVLKDENGVEINALEYNLEVMDYCLEKNDLMLTNWMHYDCIAKTHNVKLFTDEFYEVFENYLKAYTDCGFNMLLTPLFTPPLDTKIGAERMTTQLVDVKIENNKYLFDFTKLEKFIKFVMAREIEYIEFSHLFTQWGGKACPKIMAEKDGKHTNIFGWNIASLSKEYTDFLDCFLPELVKVIKKLGIENKCCFHITDEPFKEHIEIYGKCFNLVKKHIGDIPTMDAMSDYDYYKNGIVDIPVCCLDHYSSFEDKDVKKMLLYNCCCPIHSYYSNRLIQMPSQRTRVMGFQLYQCGVQGYLHWGFNFYNSQFSLSSVDPYRNNSAGDSFPAGDAFIVYPEKGGSVLKSLRAEIICESFNDYRVLKTLEKFIGREKVLALLKENGFISLTEYPRSAEVHNIFRQQINTMIKKYLKASN